MVVIANKTRHNGFLTAELVTAMVLLGLILAGMAISMHGFSMFNRYQWARHRCLAAAQAQLDGITATGRPISKEELERLWPDVSISMRKGPGKAPWDGLELIQVTATAQAGPRQVAVHLARYVRTEVAVAEGE
jgi:type II secretory pathway pseudopilin PulG